MVCNKVEPKNVLKLSKNYIAAGYKVLEDQKFEKKFQNFFFIFSKKFFIFSKKFSIFFSNFGLFLTNNCEKWFFPLQLEALLNFLHKKIAKIWRKIEKCFKKWKIFNFSSNFGYFLCRKLSKDCNWSGKNTFFTIISQEDTKIFLKNWKFFWKK